MGPPLKAAENSSVMSGKAALHPGPSMGPPLKAAENLFTQQSVRRGHTPSMGPPLKAAENDLALLVANTLALALQWGRR